MNVEYSLSLPPSINLTIKIVAEFEGFNASPYRDAAGIWKIGYGTSEYIFYAYIPSINIVEFTPILKKCEADTPPITEEKAEKILFQNIHRITVKLMWMWDNLHFYEYAALASLIHQIGDHNFYNNSAFPNLLTQINPLSRHLPLLRTPHKRKICDALLQWCYVFEVENEDLKKRREKEARIFYYGETDPTESHSKDPLLFKKLIPEKYKTFSL